MKKQLSKVYRNIIIGGICLLSLCTTALAQKTSAQKQKEALKKVAAATKVDKLQQIAQRANVKYNQMLTIAKEKGFKIKSVNEKGEIVVLHDIEVLDGKYRPVYITTHNNDGNNACTVVSKANKLWPNGGLGLSLTGKDINVAIWDGGKIKSTHQEFGSRVTIKESTGASSGDGPDHATHVAGTIGAAGTDNKAKGMAYEANLHSYNFTDGNTITELANNAQDYIISNHSWGYIAGWQFGRGFYGGGNNDWEWIESEGVFESYRYGWYNNNSAGFDEVAVNAPFHLMVVSSGNAHGFDPHSKGWPANTVYYYDGGSNTIGPASNPAHQKLDSYDNETAFAVAKNVLTVGNVNYEDLNDIQINASSSWGAPDDGRIKPDISTKGTNVYSSVATSNTAYDTYSGTSMSAPTVTGNIVLLQQHYNDLNSAYMRSATVKALVINTADEAGNHVGPDYQFGWGLLNSETAANVITDNGSKSFIGEESLSNGGTYTKKIHSDGSAPLKITIAWTDTKGAAIDGQNVTIGQVLNNRTKMLVNDLDIRITKDGTTYSPYRLDVENPTNAATVGDNDTDNVEQVYVVSPGAGEYTITVTHKGSLAAVQAFSIVATGLTTAPATDTEAPSAPTNLTSSNVTETSVDLSWTASSDNVGVTGYDVYQGTTKIISGITNTSYQVTNLTASTSYTFSVKAKDAAGNVSASSNTVNATTSDAPNNGGSSESPFTLTLVFDDYASETSWEVKDNNDQVVISGGNYTNADNNTTKVINFNLTEGCYTFVINDAYGDGMCCLYGNGSYAVTSSAGVSFSGGSFGSSVTTNFCFGPNGSSVSTFSSSNTNVFNGDKSGIGENKITWNIYPNPTKDYLNIETLNIDKAAIVKVFDLTGAEKLSVPISELKNSPLDVSSLEKGVYIIHIQTTKEGAFQHKFVKQ